MISPIRFKNNFVFFGLVALIISCKPAQEKEMPAEKSERKIAVVIHGGAGNITREGIDSISEAAYKERLNAALDTAYSILESG